MSHVFTSPELNQLVQEHLAAGEYASDEDVLIAGLKALREIEDRRRVFLNQFERRRQQLQRSHGFVIEGDDALGRFFDEIDAEVDQEFAAEQNP